MTPEQEAELFALLKKTCEYAEEHVRIAREYKAEVGDPLKKLLYAVTLVSKLIAYLVGAVLTFIGLREAWESFLMRRFK